MCRLGCGHAGAQGYYVEPGSPTPSELGDVWGWFILEHSRTCPQSILSTLLAWAQYRCGLWLPVSCNDLFILLVHLHHRRYDNWSLLSICSIFALETTVFSASIAPVFLFLTPAPGGNCDRLFAQSFWVDFLLIWYWWLNVKPCSQHMNWTVLELKTRALQWNCSYS